MKDLAVLGGYFMRYRGRLFSGMLFVALSNLFAVVSPVVVRNIIDEVNADLVNYRTVAGTTVAGEMKDLVFNMVLWGGVLLLVLALVRGVFMFFMRQTIIVMSRLIEYDQKNEIYSHYQQLDTHFFKTHFTGDLLNRLSEDVSRVRMYTGPAIMYLVNLLVLSGMCIWGMVRVDARLTLYVVAPLPLLAITIYIVNSIIYRKSEHIQSQLSGLTTIAQESFSGIRVIKSFVQESSIRRFFDTKSEEYKKSAVNLSLTESLYFPAMTLFIGLSMLGIVLIGGWLTMQGKISAGNIAEFVIYINLMMFPISSLGWVASMIQRAAASQKRINEFLHTAPSIRTPEHPQPFDPQAPVSFRDVSFTYLHTGIRALSHIDLELRAGTRVCIMGKTGSGKSTIAHLLLRMYDVQEGSVQSGGRDIRSLDLAGWRRHIAYAPQEPFLFSDTIYNNIAFGIDGASEEDVRKAAWMADVGKDILGFPDQYATVVGERGVMLSGGQKQRLALARALMRKSPVLMLDDCLSAVDTRTEKNVLERLRPYLSERTAIVISHRILSEWNFDNIVILDEGRIAEQGNHEELMRLNGYYAALYRHQRETSEEPA